MPQLSNQGLLDPALEGLVPIPGPPEVESNLSSDGEWPRMLELDPDTEARLTQYLYHEISLAWQERNTLVEDWIQWQTDYWAKPAQKVRNFPFTKSANIVIPLTAIAVEAVYANLINTIFSVKPFWSVRPRTRSWVDMAPQVEKWLQVEAEDTNSLDVYGFCRESFLELVKLGTVVGKSGYEKDVRKTIIDIPGGGTQERWVTLKNGATLDHVPLACFLLRMHEKDPQMATWVGEEHYGWTWSQMKREAQSGRIKPEALDLIKNYWSARGSESSNEKYEQEKRHIENRGDPAWYDGFDFQEIWLSFDVDGDGVDEEIVVDYHHASQTILSIRYNWYSDLHRPYRIGVYIPVEGRWAGIGVGKQNEQFQPLITTVHRQRLDAGTLANMGQLAIKKSSGYGPGEPIFPAKMWFLDSIDDIKPFSMSNTQHFAQIQNEDKALYYSEKRSRVNDMTTGTPVTGTPATATSDLAKLAEGKKVFDLVLKNSRRWLNLLGTDVLANFQQFGNKNRHWLEQEPEGQWIDVFLNLPPEHVRRGAVVELTITDSVTNKDVEQQKWQGLFAILTAHYDKVLERALIATQMTGDPTLFMAMAQMALKASNEATRRLLETVNVPDIENFLFDLRQLGAENAQSQSASTNGASTNGGSSPPIGPTGSQQPLPTLRIGSGAVP